jgi:hypothetical protein
MDDELAFRAAMADSFIGRLRSLTASQLTAIAYAHRDDGQFYGFALGLAEEATRRIGGELATAYDEALRPRLLQVEHLVAKEQQLSEGRGARELAKGAVQALLVRDIGPFNAGAFAVLFGPFSAYIALADCEDDARRTIRRNASR